MISYAALGRFASDFLVFLVGVGGVALVALRPELLSSRRAARVALAAGFMAAGTASFLEGSLIVGSTSNPAVAALRAVGILGLLLGSREWAAGPRSQRLLWIGLVAMLLATAILALRQSTTWGETALGVAGLALGVALRVASERSIAARVAANSAAILLIVVLVLSVSLSAVIGSTVRNDAGSRLDARAASEADFAQRIEPQNAVVVARNVALTFDTNTALEAETSRLVGLGDTSTGSLTAAYTSVFNQIQQFLAPAYALAYVNTAGHAYATATPAHFDHDVVASAIASDSVKQAFVDPIVGVRASIAVFKNTAFVVAVQVVAHHVTGTRFDYPTAVVAVEPLDHAYLANERQPFDPNVSLAIVSSTGVLASAGNPGPPAALISLANRTLGSDEPIPLVTANGLLSSTRPLKAGSTPVAVLVASTPGTVVTDARNRLLRTLFLLAMAGTLLAVALAAYAGERVSTGIRALTQAAQRIQEGNFVEPAGVRTDDEVGVLGGAFDSMALSIAEQTTALQEAAEEETALRSQLQAVVAGMGEALVAVDANGRITLFNRAAEELVGLDGEDVLGELVGDVLVAVGEDGSVLATRLQRPSPARWGVTATVATELGPRIPVAITSGPLRGIDGAIAGAVLVLRDLRPEREVERMKSEFLSRIGHELRTPLTGILGYAEILLRRPVPESRARDMHQQIVDAGRRLYRVVQMLEFSAAAEAGRSLLRSEPMSVRQIVDEVVAGWGPRLNGNHTVARRVARRLPDVRGDRRWLAMAIDELIDNAVKFSPDGGRVGVIAQPVQWFDSGESRTAVQIVVTDEGVGLTESEQHSAFSDFVQGDGSDTRRFGGLGLGLSLVKRVAEAHGGTVEVNSVVRKGSKFSIILPVISSDEGA